MNADFLSNFILLDKQSNTPSHLSHPPSFLFQYPFLNANQSTKMSGIVVIYQKNY